jgi:AraC-like DNA-binding protein
MESAAGAYGDGLARYFRADASSHVAAEGLRRSKLAVTRIRRDMPSHGFTSALPAEPAFSVLLQLRDCAKRELFIGGRSVCRDGYGARTTSIVDLEEQPVAHLESPFDVMHFYVSRAALDEIADDQGASRVATLACDRGTFDPIVWHLGEALAPALERPEEVSAMYAHQLLLATHTYFATAFGGMRAPPSSGRGTLAPWQLRRAIEIMSDDPGKDMSLADPARACGLSVSYFTRAFSRSTGMPPHRWLLHHRVLRAKTMLRETSSSLADIAYALGFCDQSHFTRVFTGIVGASPGVWRKLVR